MTTRNPKDNITPHPDQGKTGDESNVSPEPSGAHGFIKMEPADDIRAPRIERLGQFLSESTLGNVTEDVRYPGKNFFPISAEPAEATTTVQTNSRPGQTRYTDLIETAKTEFDKLSRETSFSAETFRLIYRDPPDRRCAPRGTTPLGPSLQ